jgi:uncharacterized protein (TIGR00730 family)
MDKTKAKPAPDAVVPGVEPLEPISVRRSPTRQPMRRRRGSGDPAIDDRIRELLDSVEVADEDLLQDILETSFRMARASNRGEMKLVSRSLRELGRAFRIFAPYRGTRKVSIFGSARIAQDDAAYVVARDFSAEIASRGWMVITGAGPGIMAAGHEGAGKRNSFGVGIRLPMEQGANGFIAGDPKLIDFKYFFTRKITFMKESDAFVLMPGGFGTLDEAFELLTLMQTGKTSVRPVVLLDTPGGHYWTHWVAFVQDHLVGRGLASPEDMALMECAETIDEAVAAIERFYTNYVSARYVGERLVIRLKRRPSASDLARLNDEFADVIAAGGIQAITATPEEVRDGDSVDSPRIAFHAVHNFGRIRQLIDALNRLP